MLVVLGPLPCQLGLLVSQEIGVRLLFLGFVSQRLVGVCPQDVNEEMRWGRKADRIRLGDGGVGIATGQLQQSHVIPRVGIEARQLRIGTECHRQEELNAVDLSGLGLTAMMSRFDALNGTSAISRQANESMNGYDTTRYAINSTTAGDPDQRKFAALFGAGAFEKGTVWVPADGCAVKLVLDERMLFGSNLKDAHYELARVRK